MWPSGAPIDQSSCRDEAQVLAPTSLANQLPPLGHSKRPWALIYSSRSAMFGLRLDVYPKLLSLHSSFGWHPVNRLTGVSSKCFSSSCLLTGKRIHPTSCTSQQQRCLTSASSTIRMNMRFDLTRVHACENVLHYRFRHPLLLWEALQPKGSYTCGLIVKRVKQSRYESGNLRLAIIVDEIMDALLAESWYRSGASRRKSGRDGEKIQSASW